MTSIPTAGIRFSKGHGTENDFVVIPDPDGDLTIGPALVRALCDRASGIGADGIIRVVRDEAGWFMDHRNADGSEALMCGNGARLFAAYLVRQGWADAGEITFGTRSGPRTAVVLPDGRVRLGMGQVTMRGSSIATLASGAPIGPALAGRAVDVGNPHLVCPVDAEVLAELDLTVAPGHSDELFPDGVNVEFVAPVEPGTVRMRVHERGVGETRSCGTGTVATAAAVLADAAESADVVDGAVRVEVLGGVIDVEITGGAATITGPAEIVADGVIRADWWQKHSAIREA